MSAQNKNAFTLIELLVVITIIAVLAVIGFAMFGGAASKAKDAKRRSDIDAIVKAFETNYDPILGVYKAISGSDFTGGKIPNPPEGHSYDFIALGSPGGPYKGFKMCAKLQSKLDSTNDLPCMDNSAGCYCKESAQGEKAGPGILASALTKDDGSFNQDAGRSSDTYPTPVSYKTPPPSGSTSKGLSCENFGDMDKNGQITENDIQIISNKFQANTLSDDEKIIADVNYDGSSGLGTVSLGDIQHLGNYLNNNISNLTVCANIKSPPCSNIGDVTGDGKVTIMDDKEVRRMIVGGFNSLYTGQPYTDAQRKKADVNASGSVTVTDSTLIQRYLDGTITTFSACSVTSRALDCENYGDVDGNRLITNNDASLINGFDSGTVSLTEDQKILADVNYDPSSNTSPGTTVDGIDTLKIQRYIDGLDPHLPICLTTRQVPNPPGNGIGDVSINGIVTWMDKQEISRILSGGYNSLYTNQPYTADQRTRADFSRDGSVNSLDVLCLGRFLNNLPATTLCPLQ